jgi:SagB-type dehydrogenase family enzyme
MRRRTFLTTLAALGATLSLAACTENKPPEEPTGELTEQSDNVVFREPQLDHGVSLERALERRRSVRRYREETLSEDQIGQLCWATQGITASWGGRTAPSAGALYPLEIYVATAEGCFYYDPDTHALSQTLAEDRQDALWRAGLRQEWLRQAPAVFVITAVYARTAARYGNRAERYAILEVGHAAQNLLLQAVTLDLAAVPIGAFHDAQVAQALDLPDDHTPLYLIPVGHPV